MTDKLAIIVMGHANSGKTSTWISLFGRTVKTGTTLRRLYFNQQEYTNVFLVSGSPEERGKYVGDLITHPNAQIVLCSMQYRADSSETIDYFITQGYSLYIQWLNPGYHDGSKEMYYDSLGIGSSLLSKQAILSIRNGKTRTESRVREIRDYLYGWAMSRDLISSD